MYVLQRLLSMMPQLPVQVHCHESVNKLSTLVVGKPYDKLLCTPNNREILFIDTPHNNKVQEYTCFNCFIKKRKKKTKWGLARPNFLN